MDIDNALVIDLETSINNVGEESVGKNRASPFCADNKIVAVGWKWLGSTLSEHPHTVITRYNGWSPELFNFKIECLVGHNIKFDLLYMLQKGMPGVRKWFDGPGIVWDTQLAEYLLSGQSLLYPSLDYCSEKRGGTLKDDRIKEYWENGVKTEDIPKDQLIEYLKYDVENTDIVFKSQLLEAQERGMLPLLYSQMRALKATIEMENNGLHFDSSGARKTSFAIDHALRGKYDELKKDMKIIMNRMDMKDINPMSNDQISICLFGGQYKIRADVCVFDDNNAIVKYKSGAKKGQIKTRKEDRYYKTVGLGADSRRFGTASAKAGIYSTDNATITKIMAFYPLGSVANFCERLLHIREMSKDLNTYYIGYSNLVWPDGNIHGQLNHCATATGRLASSAPNLQNISGD